MGNQSPGAWPAPRAVERASAGHPNEPIRTPPPRRTRLEAVGGPPQPRATPRNPGGTSGGCPAGRTKFLFGVRPHPRSDEEESVVQRILIVLGSCALLYVGGTRFWRSLMTPEEAIEWRIEKMVSGFNDTRMAPVISGFSDNYVDEASGVDRTDMMRILAHLFFTETDPETKAFRLQVELVDSSLSIAIDGAGTARVSFELFFRDTFKGTTREYWRPRIDAELTNGARGWTFTRSINVDHSSRERLR